MQLPQGPQHARPEDIGEHIRVELLDPKWREEKKNFAARQAGDNYAEVTNVGQNLDQMARRRRDIFGDEDEEGVSSSGPGHKEALQKAIQSGLYRVNQPVLKAGGNDDSDDDDGAAKQRPASAPVASKATVAPVHAAQAPSLQAVAAAASRPGLPPSMASAQRPPIVPASGAPAPGPSAMPTGQPNMPPGMPPMPAMHPGMMGLPPGAGMPGMHGFPPQPGMHGMMMNSLPGMMMPQGAQQLVGQTAAGEDLGKRGRESGELIPAEEFLQQFPGDVTVRFVIHLSCCLASHLIYFCRCMCAAQPSRNWCSGRCRVNP